MFINMVFITILYNLITYIMMSFNSLVKSEPILDIDSKFSEHEKIKKKWKTIRDELLNNINKLKIPNYNKINSRGKDLMGDNINWGILGLRLYGNDIKENIKHFPKTWEILKDIPNLSTITFSILDPKKYIPPHSGPYKGIMRYFLCLDIPDGECYLLVDGIRYDFKNGDDILWDDTYTHSVLNNTNDKRMILLCDVYRSDLNPITQKINDLFFFIVKNSKFLIDYTKKGEVQEKYRE